MAACGTLPCIAPEMLTDESYLPSLADCWSAGVVLLEAAGGLNTFEVALQLDLHAEQHAIAGRINNFFAQPGAHGRALSIQNNVNHWQVLELLELLLQPEDQRWSVQKLFEKKPELQSHLKVPIEDLPQ